MRALICIVLIAAAGLAAGAGLYKWMDEKGRVQYSDTPPPPGAKSVEQPRLQASTIPAADMPYAVRQAAKNFPVTLWINNCGELCNSARAHLAKRGVPFAERDPSRPEESEAFKQLTAGRLEVPLLAVGQLRILKGYQAGEWDAALDDAGYPRNAPPLKPAAPPPALPAR